MKKVNQNRLIQTFQHLVEMDSPSLGERQVGQFLAEQLTALGLSVSEDDAGIQLGGNCGNLYCHWEGSDNGGKEAPLLFSAHLDTVEPSRGKKAVILPDGTIRSAGDTVLGADDFAGVAAILEAVRTIAEKKLPHREIELLFSVAEEIYSGGATHFNYEQLKAKEAYVLDLSGPIGNCAYRAPTIFAFTAEFEGKSAHAGFAPETGANAIAAAAKAIASIRQGRVAESLTVNIGKIEGGTARNIVSDYCLVQGEIRSNPHALSVEQYEKIKNHFTKVAQTFGVNVSFSHQIGCMAYETPKELPVVQRVKHACEACGIPFKLIETFGGSDNNHFVRHGMSGVVLACGMRDCHSTKEQSHVDELTRAARLVVQIMTDVTGDSTREKEAEGRI
ncbi:MAG: M20/M25/M40 family metallo-hydrolase [Oscillospiraceae bacterium]|nr:M20/M25/M40 family metallo-hydrolase [Oscillospiraceae bacterium]